MAKVRPTGDYVQVSSWIKRTDKAILEALGGPSHLLREQITKKGGLKVRLLHEREDLQLTIKESEERLKAVEEALSAIEEQERKEKEEKDKKKMLKNKGNKGSR